jgi:hypothetical protein
MTDDIRANGLNGESRDRAPDAEQLLADWRQAVASEIAALEATNNAVPPDPDLEHAYKAAVEHVRRIAREVWSTPVSGPVALRLRAEIAQHCLWANYHGEGIRRFEAVLAGQEQDDSLKLGPIDEQAVAELVKAILWAGAPARPEPALPETRQAPAADREARDDLEDLVGRAKAGVDTLFLLWTHECSGRDSKAIGATLWFAATGLADLLERIEARVAAMGTAPG